LHVCLCVIIATKKLPLNFDSYFMRNEDVHQHNTRNAKNLHRLSIRTSYVRPGSNVALYTYAHPNTNEQKLLFLVICVRISIWKVRRFNRAEGRIRGGIGWLVNPLVPLLVVYAWNKESEQNYHWRFFSDFSRIVPVSFCQVSHPPSKILDPPLWALKYSRGNN